MSTISLTTNASVRTMLGDTAAEEGDLTAYSDEQIDETIEQASAFVWKYTGAAEAELLVDPDDDPPVAVPDVARAVTALAAYWLRQAGAPGNEFQSDQRRDGEGYAMPTSTMQLLAPYRRIGFGADWAS